MKSIVEIRGEIKARKDKMLEMVNGADLESRKLTADEAKAFDKLQSEVDGLDQDLQHEERRLMAGMGAGAPVGGDKGKEAAEQRGIRLKGGHSVPVEARVLLPRMEGRTVTLSSDGVILPGFQADTINRTFNEVSGLVDRVNIKMFQGGESFRQPYVAGYGTAGYATEGGNPSTAETTFGYAEINKTKIAAYAEDSEELIKLAAANYDAEVVKGISIAIRKYINSQILFGDGASGHFVGIFDDGATAIDADTDIELSAIDETTLDEVMYSYGGDEDVEDTAVLILCKPDLKAFVQLRDSEGGRKIHEVKSRGNSGTIDGVPFLINSNCKSIGGVATTSGMYSMAYGPLSNYVMAIFSDMEVTRSTDYKHKEGLISHRGVIFAGGNVAAKNGFIRAKKK